MKHLWSSLLKGTAITGRSLFDEAYRAEVSAEVSQIRSAEKIGSREHVGMLNSRLKTRWESLGDGKQEWDLQAESLKTSTDANLIYQYDFLLYITVTLLIFFIC